MAFVVARKGHHKIIGPLITCIYNLNSYLISLIFMLILCNYDACYLNFYEFSPLECDSTKVHIYAQFSVNYELS